MHPMSRYEKFEQASSNRAYASYEKSRMVSQHYKEVPLRQPSYTSHAMSTVSKNARDIDLARERASLAIERNRTKGYSEQEFAACASASTIPRPSEAKANYLSNLALLKARSSRRSESISSAPSELPRPVVHARRASAAEQLHSPYAPRMQTSFRHQMSDAERRKPSAVSHPRRASINLPVTSSNRFSTSSSISEPQYTNQRHSRTLSRQFAHKEEEEEEEQKDDVSIKDERERKNRSFSSCDYYSRDEDSRTERLRSADYKKVSSNGCSNDSNDTNCDKCDSKLHRTETCPHFKKGRDKHMDAQRGKPRSIGADGKIVFLKSAKVVTMPGDGSCLFHSLAHGLRSGQSARMLRKEIADFILRNPQLEIAETPLKDWIHWDSGRSVASYARQMAVRGWGGGIECAACSRLCRVNVHIYEKVGKRRYSQNGNGVEYKRISCFNLPGPEGKTAKTINVLYCGGVHYNALEI